MDREGSELKTQTSYVENFYDEDAISSTYDAEVRELVREATAALRVEIVEHSRRAASTEARHKHGIREPTVTIHNDYDTDSGPNRLRDIYPDEADALLNNNTLVMPSSDGLYTVEIGGSPQPVNAEITANGIGQINNPDVKRKKQPIRRD